jgi:energy-coupling factor transport system ATP-binding protein
MTRENIAVFDNVSYIYPQATEPALHDLTLTLRRGEFVGLIGPTGAGKSTLCQTLNGVVPQFHGGRFFGRLTIAGLDTLEQPVSTLARHVGIVLEDPESQLVTTSVENEVAFALENMRMPRDEILTRIPRVLEWVRLDGLERRHPQELSAGQKQRLAIAAVLAMQPDLLVLDEATSQLDPMGAEEIFDTVRELNRELEVTILMASHAAEELAEHADRVLLLDEGRLIADGPPTEIYAQVEMLEAHHLRPPQVTHTLYMISQQGTSVPHLPVDMAEGRALLQKLPRICPECAHPLTCAHSQDAPPLLSLDNVSYTYENGTEALNSVSLDISRGEYLLLIGQNGAGKSTLVKHFVKLLTPTAGSVHIDGKDTRTLTVPQLTRRIGYVGQHPDHQIFTASVEEEVAFALHNLGYARDEIEERTTASLISMGLLEQRHAHPLSLPRGDRARVVIAAVLATQPEIVIFDEPTTGQDYRGARYILELSKRLHEQGKTVIVITHHLYLMPDYAERVVVMGKGTLLLDAPIRQAYHETALLRKTYLTPPQAVLLSQALCHDTDGTPHHNLTPREVAACFPAGGEA